MEEHFTGRAMTIEEATATATDVAVGEMLEPGQPDVGAPGQAFYDGARLHVIRTLSGPVPNAGGTPAPPAAAREIAFSYTQQRLPPSLAEAIPAKGGTFVFFLVKKSDGAYRAIKILRADEVGLRQVDDALRRRK
jgi:hypothetical protein